MLKREHWLRDLKQNLETSIQNAPLGNLKIINCRGVEQYYLDSAETRTSYPNGKYLRKSDFELAGKLAQRNYDEKLLSEVEKQLKNIQNIIKKYEKQEIVQVEELYSVYDRMSPSRKKMVDARIISDKEYVNQWSAKIYSGKDFAEGQAEIYTEKKERVRSKSEKIIADMLYHKNIPYKYECPINLKGLGMIYPDFTCLRLADRKTILWEHLGMMTDPIYCQKAMKKIVTVPVSFSPFSLKSKPSISLCIIEIISVALIALTYFTSRLIFLPAVLNGFYSFCHILYFQPLLCNRQAKYHQLFFSNLWCSRYTSLKVILLPSPLPLQ